MIKIQGDIDRHVVLACSGGIDSMAVLDFLSRNHSVTVAFFDHGTETSAEAKDFITDFINQKNSVFHEEPKGNTLRLEVGHIKREKEKRESTEEYWRNERYDWFQTFDTPVITCHHLDDCTETWIWSSLNGRGKIIPYRNVNVIRPFRLNRKSVFVNWCRRNGVPWVEDTSNADTKHMRNYIRHELMPKALNVNPGLHKVISKKVMGDPNVNNMKKDEKSS